MPFAAKNACRVRAKNRSAMLIGQLVDQAFEGDRIFLVARGEQCRGGIADQSHLPGAALRARTEQGGQGLCRPFHIQAAVDHQLGQRFVGIDRDVGARMGTVRVSGDAACVQGPFDGLSMRPDQHHDTGVAGQQARGDEITGRLRRVGLVIKVNSVTAH